MSSSPSKHTDERREREGVKETLESIVVALILAFVFRAFIVEAFVIPTGSMAPTLYGAHGTIVCEDCGWEFAYGVQDLADTRRMMPVRRSSRAICPNCNHPNTNLPISDEYRNPAKGDRILVLKWPFDVDGPWLGPARWDVTVFKDPADGVTNFIKRLVGLPNEVLMIVDGDVYTVPTERLSKPTLTALEKIVYAKYEFVTGQRGGMLPPLPSQVLTELDEKMHIARKTPAAQEALWRILYDNDFPPRTLDPYQPRWVSPRAGSGWDASSRTVTFRDTGVEGDYVELEGKEIRATSAYNIHGGQGAPVSDLRVRFVFTPRSDDAAVSVRLEKRDRTFWATIRADGYLTLTESREVPGPHDHPMAATQVAALVPGQPVEISFEHVDYRLALRVGGSEVLASSDDPASPAFYAPNLSALRRTSTRYAPPPRIYGSGGGAFEIAHLRVMRDTHYYHDPHSRALSLPWAPRSGWGSAGSPILLRDHEYFMLGDNTAASKDSRLWDEVGPHLRSRGERFQLGTVPGDQLIGKAFFVYWPSGYRITWLPRMGTWTWPVIPDVGRMRWIR